jgi:hypothetical protein
MRFEIVINLLHRLGLRSHMKVMGAWLRSRTRECGFLCPHPGKYVATLTARRARPVQALERFALCPGPPVFLRHHQAPSATAGAHQRDDFDGKPMIGTSKAVSLALELHPVECPARQFQTRIARAQSKSNARKKAGPTMLFTGSLSPRRAFALMASITIQGKAGRVRTRLASGSNRNHYVAWEPGVT